MSEFSIVNFFPLVFISFIFYFLIIRPQQKKNKEIKQMLESIKIGDNVLLNSGIYCSVKEYNKDKTYCKLEIAKDVVIKIEKSEILSLIKQD